VAIEAIAARAPDEGAEDGREALEAFIGSEDSGDPSWASDALDGARREEWNRLR
jgi:hypothetical protein